MKNLTVGDIMFYARYQQCVDVFNNFPELVLHIKKYSRNIYWLHSNIKKTFGIDVDMDELRASNKSVPELKDIIIMTYAHSTTHKTPVPDRYIKYVMNKAR